MNPRVDAFLRTAGLVAGAAVCIDGVVCWKFCGEVRIRDYVASLLLILLGLVLMVAEVAHWLKNKVKFLMKAISFLKYRTGRGFFYLIAGSLTLTEQTWTLLLGAVVMLVGVLNLAAVVRMQCTAKTKKKSDKVDLPEVQAESDETSVPSFDGSDERPGSSLTHNAV